MEYHTDWEKFKHKNIERIRWESSSEPTEFRDNGRLLIHFTDNQGIYEPVMYGWFILIKSIESNDNIISHIVSGIIPVMRTEENNNLIDQLSNVMDLDELEKSLLIRIHGVALDCSVQYGIISERFTPKLSCSLLAYLLHKHRGRDKSDCWDRAGATHSSVTAQDAKNRFNNISQKKTEAIQSIISLNSTTSQSELPSIHLNN